MPFGGPHPGMRILFVMDNPGTAVRPFNSVLRLLETRGHQIHLAFQRLTTSESYNELRRLADECPGITFGKVPSSAGSSWAPLTRSLRFGADYLRYFDPRFTEATKLRATAKRRAPATVRRLARLAGLLGPTAILSLRGVIEALERSMPPPDRVERFVAEHDPDLVLVTPLVLLGSVQAGWLRAAKRLGIRSVYPVLSWDNLTTKGLIRDIPDLMRSRCTRCFWTSFERRRKGRSTSTI